MASLKELAGQSQPRLSLKDLAREREEREAEERKARLAQMEEEARKTRESPPPAASLAESPRPQLASPKMTKQQVVDKYHSLMKAPQPISPTPSPAMTNRARGMGVAPKLQPVATAGPAGRNIQKQTVAPPVNKNPGCKAAQSPLSVSGCGPTLWLASAHSPAEFRGRLT
jgi:hypothetical protein